MESPTCGDGLIHGSHVHKYIVKYMAGANTVTRGAGLVCMRTCRWSHKSTETKRYMGDGEWRESERQTYRQT